MDKRCHSCQPSRPKRVRVIIIKMVKNAPKGKKRTKDENVCYDHIESSEHSSDSEEVRQPVYRKTKKCTSSSAEYSRRYRSKPGYKGSEAHKRDLQRRRERYQERGDPRPEKLKKLTKLEKENAKLKKDNAKLKDKNAELERENRDFRKQAENPESPLNSGWKAKLQASHFALTNFQEAVYLARYLRDVAAVASKFAYERLVPNHSFTLKWQDKQCKSKDERFHFTEEEELVCDFINKNRAYHSKRRVTRLVEGLETLPDDLRPKDNNNEAQET